MNKYEILGVVGEGSYGVVMKCTQKESGQLVAIKKFLESDDDQLIKKIAMREINMLRKLRHENLVNLIEVFRRKRHLYLVLEYVDHTILDELEQCTGGLGHELSRNYTWQILRGVDFCHSLNIIHRDVKPENILVTQSGVVKLCDFGFARILASFGESCTDYVATRWYRSPELLVGDTRYGKEVDVWAVGCVFAELVTGDPLFPGESDIDQLFCIIQHLGNLVEKHRDMMTKNPMFQGVNHRINQNMIPLRKRFNTWSKLALNFLQECLHLDPDKRSSTSKLLQDLYFTFDGFPDRFLPQLQKMIKNEFSSSLNIKITSAKKRMVFPRKINPSITQFEQETGGETVEHWTPPSSNSSNSQLLPLSSLSSKFTPPASLRPPTKINLLNSPSRTTTMTNSPTTRPGDPFVEAVNLSTAIAIPHIEQSGSSITSNKLSPYLPLNPRLQETNSLQHSPSWSRKPTPNFMKGSNFKDVFPEVIQSLSPSEELGGVHGERSLLYSRYDNLRSNKPSPKDTGVNVMNSPILPSIPSPVFFNPPEKTNFTLRSRKPFFPATLEPLPKKPSENATLQSPSLSRRFSTWKYWPL